MRVAAFPDDAHEVERSVSHRKPRRERFGGVLCAVAGEVDPAVLAECLDGALISGRFAGDALEQDVRGHVSVSSWIL